MSYTGKLVAVITAQDKASSVFKKVGGNLANMGTMALNFGAIATAAIGAAGGFAIKSAADIQQSRVAIDSMLGSADNGRKIFGDLTKIASKTPFQIEDLALAAKTLIQYGSTSENVIDEMKMLGDVAMGNKDNFQLLSLAFGQVQAKGRLTGEEVRQMVNSGFNPLQAISEKTGQSMEELSDKMRRGEISFEDVKDSMVDTTSEGGKFFEGMEKGSQTVGGLFSTLSDTIGITAREIIGLSEEGDVIEGSLFQMIQDNLPKIIDLVSTLGEAITPLIQEGFEKLVEVIGNVVEKVKKINEFFKEHEIIAGILKEVLTAIAIAIGIVTAAVVVLNIAMGVFAILTSPITLILGFIIGVLTILILTVKLVVEKWIEYWPKMAEIIGQVWGIIRERISSAWNWIKSNVFIPVAAFISRTYIQPFINAKNRIVDTFNFIKSKFADLKNKIISIGTGIVDWFRGLPDKIANALLGLGGSISSAIGSGIRSVPVIGDKVADIMGLAIGGPAAEGKSYVVGENGPELFTPNVGGRVTPAEQTKAMSNNYGGVNITISGAGDPRAVAQEVKRILAADNLSASLGLNPAFG